MSFPAYPRYRATSSTPLGRVPEHWGVMHLKWFSTLHRGFDLTNDECEDGPFPVVTSGGISGFHSIAMARGPGVVTGRYGSTGQLFFVTEDYWPHNTTLFVSDFHGNDERFVWYSLQAVDFATHSAKSAVPGIDRNDLHVLPTAVPPLDEQRAIQAFLDLETAKIDGLVAEQRRLIALLQEKRQALISHAVTKGLDPTAPLKPTGIDWLGDVPKSWKVVAVRRLLTGIEQGWSPQCDSRPADQHEWGILKTGCVNRGVFSENENKALSEDLEPIVEYEVKAGDVLMSRASGSPDLVGATAFVERVRPHLMLSDKTFRIHLGKSIDPRFFVAMLNALPMRAQIVQSISGADGLANNLPQSKLRRFVLALPSPSEQQEIVRQLGQWCGKIDRLIAEAKRVSDLLQERRTALISAAVTGKIDVRDLATTEAVA